MKYIDIHTHIAYDLDDGAKTKEETKQFIEIAKQQNYEAIVLTPHINYNTIHQYEEIYQRYLEIKQYTNEIKIYLGNEILINEQMIKLLQTKKFYPINESKYLLIECDLKQSYHHMLEDLYLYLNNILSLGYIPVIAHVERYYKDKIDLDDIEYLIQKGCIIQINTTSILHEKDYKKVQPLLEHHYVHVIASDAHDLKRRTLNMDEVYHILKKKHFDITYIEDMMYYHPKTMIQNQKIQIREYQKRNVIYQWLKT